MHSVLPSIFLEEMICFPPLWIWFIFLGLGSWVTLSGLFSELALFAVSQPEGWSLSSRLTLATSLGNVFPFLYALAGPRAQRFSPLLTHLTLLAALAATCSLALFWQHVHNGVSLGLILPSFVGGAADAMTTMLFWPLALSHGQVESLATGEGLSALIAGLLSIVQDPARTPPRFSVSLYFAAMSAVVLVSWAAFGVIISSPKPGACGASNPSETRDRSMYAPIMETCDQNLHNPVTINDEVEPSSLPAATPRTCLFVLFLSSFLSNAVVPAVSTYACLPYPHGRTILLWAGVLSMITDPLAPVVARFLPWHALALQTLVWTSTSLYIFSIAIRPVAIQSLAAGWLAVAVFAVNKFMISYSRTIAFKTIGQHKGFLGGGMVQAGACIGSLLMYVLVNHTLIFKQRL